MARYRVCVRVLPFTSCGSLNARDALTARQVVPAPCARMAACELAAPYVAAGLVVDWSVRRSGVRGLGRRWSGRFVPDGDDGAAGVREPRRPYLPVGGASAEVRPPAA